MKRWLIVLIGLLVACTTSPEPVEQPSCDEHGNAFAETFAALGIEDDDALWVCENPPEKLEDLAGAARAAGVRLCFAQQDGVVPGDAIYVAPDGNDANSGASRGEALHTLGAALCRAAPGQTVYLAPGVYHEGVMLALENQPDAAPLHIVGMGESPEDVRLDGERWRTFGIYLLETHHVLIENLTVQNYAGSGIQTLLGSGVTLRKVVVRHNGRCNPDADAEGEGFGVNLVGTGQIEVAESVFVDNGPLLAQVRCGKVLGTGIDTFEASGAIHDNIIRATRGGAMLIEKSSGPFEVFGNLAERNFLLAVNNYWDAGLWIDESTDVVVRDNIFRDNFGGAGVEVSDEEHAYPETSHRLQISGNQISGNTVGILVWGYGVCPPPEDVILNWQDLERDNPMRDNVFRSEQRNIWCIPDFVGGDLP